MHCVKFSTKAEEKSCTYYKKERIYINLEITVQQVVLEICRNVLMLFRHVKIN